MTSEQKTLLLLMAKAMRQQPAGWEDVEAVDWKALVWEAYVQAVPMLFFESVSHLQAQIPQECWDKMFMLARRGTARNIRCGFTQQELTTVLQKDYPYVILKGEAAAAYYPVPELRAMGDVDFMTAPEYTAPIVKKMVEKGFTHVDREGEHHQRLHRMNERIEMHLEPAGMPEGEKGNSIRDFLQSVYTQRRYIEKADGGFYSPSHAHHGLILLLHMQHHMTEGGFGLRHLMDWACYVKETAEEPFWQDILLPLLKKIGLRRYGAVVTKMAAQYLQFSCPLWAMDAPEALCRELMEDLFAGGNFGRKDKERSRSGNMLPEYGQENGKKGRLAMLMHTLYNSSLLLKPALKKKPVRLVFYMIYRAFRYIALQCVGKRANLLKAAGYAQERKNAFDQLQLFEEE